MCRNSFCYQGVAASDKQVEAAGQDTQSFRIGLDYAFIPSSGMRGVLAPKILVLLVPTHPYSGQWVYKSLQGQPGVGLLLTPRRYPGL
jgi:hypothetical protein